MGTWGVHSFENDDAVEWAAAYREMGLSVAQSTLQIALSDHSNNSLTADLSCRALAGVEAVAFALGRGSAEAKKAFEGGPEVDVALAQTLIPECDNMIAALTGESALKELWREVGAAEFEAWKASIAELGDRVNGAAAVEPVAEAVPEVRAEAQPVTRVIADAGGSELDDIRMALVELSAEVQALREESALNFRRLAKRIEGRDQ